MARTKSPGRSPRRLDAPAETSEVLTLAEAAAYLRLPEGEVLCLIREQGLPARQAGTEWRILKEALRLWLATGSFQPEDRKAAQMAQAGKYADDPDLLEICEEAYRDRKRNRVGN